MPSLDAEPIGRVARACGLVMFAWVLLRTAWLCDDAFISFRVVENAVSGFGLRWNVAERVQVFTHPLWMLLHIPLRAVTGEIYYTSLFLCATASIGACWLLALRVASTAHAGGLAMALAFSSKIFVDYSTSGLENPLTHLLLAGFFVAGLRNTPSGNTFLVQSLLAGLITFNRLDTLLLVAPALAVAAKRLGFVRAWKPLLAGFAAPAAWFGFATIYYGNPFPNTALAKLGAGTELGEVLYGGFRYYLASLRLDPLMLPTVFLALAITALRRRHSAIGVGIVLYLAYVFYIGGDFMGGRFFTAPFVFSLAILAREASRWPRRYVLVVAVAIAGLGLLPAGSPLTSGPTYGLDRPSLIGPYGIADERAFYFRRSGLWNETATTLPRDDHWLEANSARECGFPLLVAGAIGFYGYEAGPAVHILDYHALADPLLSRLPAVKVDRLYIDWYRAIEGREPKMQRRIGHFLRNVPSGYVSFLLGDPADFDSEEMRRLVETVATATRDPIWSLRRIRAVADLAFGNVTEGFDSPVFTQFGSLPLDEILASERDIVLKATIRGCKIMISDPVGATVALREAVSRCPANGLAWKCLSRAAASTTAGREALDEVLLATAKIVELAPLADWAHYDYSLALLAADRQEEAIRALERAVELNRWNDEALRELASLRLGSNDSRAAVEALERAVARRPKSPELWRALGDARASAGDADGAAAARAKAARLGG